ncbi:MAG: aminotransferase [Acidobacteriota bacterium]|nr:aminotransferase [Acidobacteriota bacterium]
MPPANCQSSSGASLLSSTSLEDLDRRTLIHPYTSIADHEASGPMIIDSADGVRIRDRAGNEYIDAMAGLWCVNVGYGRTELIDAMAEQGRKLPYYHLFASMSNEPAIRLAKRLTDLAPANLTKVFFANSGSEANDTQIKIVRYYNNVLGRPRKKKILSRQAAYHGVTLGATSLSGLPPMHGVFDLPLDGFLHLSRPHHYWDAPVGTTEEEFSAILGRELEQKIDEEGADTIAAMIVEPVMGAGGVIVPPQGYFENIVPILRANDILLIVDEVICGFGRLGRWFGSERFGLEPDLMSIAKGLTSGYFPMSASVVSEEIWEVLRKGSEVHGPFSHGHTYTAHPLAAATAMANLDVIERDGLIEKAAQTEPYLQNRLRTALADHPLVGEVRGLGMLAAVELVAQKTAKTPFAPEMKAGQRLSNLLREEGVISRAMRDTLAMSPPLILERADVDTIVDAFALCLDRLVPELESTGWAAG